MTAVHGWGPLRALSEELREATGDLNAALAELEERLQICPVQAAVVLRACVPRTPDGELLVWGKLGSGKRWCLLYAPTPDAPRQPLLSASREIRVAAAHAADALVREVHARLRAERAACLAATQVVRSIAAGIPEEPEGT